MSLPSLSTVPRGDEPPFEPEAVVREVDTWLVLSAAPDLVEPPDGGAPDPADLLRGADAYEPRTPGSVVVREGTFLELLAVVHDLDREPSCRPEWVDEALERVMEELHARGAGSVALPVLGAVHGTLHPLRFHRALRDAVERVSPWALRDICLEVPAGVDPRAIRDVERLWSGG